MSESLDRLSAFIDGETVPSAELAEALATPEAREALRSFVWLREQVQLDDQPSAAFYARMDAVLRADERSEPRVPWWRRAISIPLPALAPAIAAVAIAFWVASSQTSSVAEPPSTYKILTFSASEWNVGSKGGIR